MKQGFTLIELLVVSTIIATLIGVASVSFIRATQSSRDARRLTDLEQIRQALETYRSESGAYPTTAQGTSVLSPNYITTIPKDPKISTTSYTYTGTATTYSLCSTLVELKTPSPYCVTQP